MPADASRLTQTSIGKCQYRQFASLVKWEIVDVFNDSKALAVGFFYGQITALLFDVSRDLKRPTTAADQRPARSAESTAGAKEP
jgi:hypothetical protein